MLPDADPKRTGIKASRIDWAEPPLELIGHRWHGPPGAMIFREGSVGDFLLCCPGCGEVGSARDGAKWTPTAGDWGDVATLTLTPSIAKSCCGWHGYLRNGAFVTD